MLALNNSLARLLSTKLILVGNSNLFTSQRNQAITYYTHNQLIYRNHWDSSDTSATQLCCPNWTETIGILQIRQPRTSVARTEQKPLGFFRFVSHVPLLPELNRNHWDSSDSSATHLCCPNWTETIGILQIRQPRTSVARTEQKPLQFFRVVSHAPLLPELNMSTYCHIHVSVCVRDDDDRGGDDDAGGNEL